MSDIQEAIKENRPYLRPSSLQTYESNLRSLYRKMTYDYKMPSPTWFDEHTDEILQYLKTAEPKQRKLKLAALLVLTKKKDIAAKYYDLMMKDVKAVKEEETEQKKTPKQKENWMSLEEIKQIHTDMKFNAQRIFKKSQINEGEREIVFNYLILSLYVLQPPRRLLDYIEMLLHEEDDKQNYIVINRKEKKFIFNVYKTAKHHGKQEIDIDSALVYILQRWRKLNPTQKWLLQEGDNKMTQTQLTRRLNKIFGKRVSVNMIRHIFISDAVLKDMPALSQLQETANAMGHNVNMQMLYKKIDE
jgi:hypothetical protein